MPYIVAKSETKVASADFVSPVSVAVPAGHQANDLLLCFVSQDTGTGTISISGWTEIGTQAAGNAQRLAAFYKLAASSSEAAAAVASTLTDDVTAIMLVVRGVNTTTPIHGNARANTGAAETLPQAPALTTTNNNCLILQVWSYDDYTGRFVPESLVGLGYVTRGYSTGTVYAIGSFMQRTAGAVTRYKMRSSQTDEGGTVLTIAINDSGDNYSAPELAAAPLVLSNLSYFHTTFDGITWQAPDALAATTIGGRPLLSTMSSGWTAGSPDAIHESSFYAVGSGEATTVDSVMGGSHAISPAWDLSTAILALRIGKSYDSAIFNGFPFYVVLEDSAGEWAAYMLSHDAVDFEVCTVATYQAVFSPSLNTPDETSTGTLDLSDIVRIGYLCGRAITTSTTTRFFVLRHLLRLDPFVFVGGSVAAPLSMRYLRDLGCGWLDYDPIITTQGYGQVLLRSSVQFGNGTTTTYVDLQANAGEFPLSWDKSLERRFWHIPDNAIEIRIKASANDTMRVRNCVFATDTRQDFVIDSGSSTSATYDFAGLVLAGFDVSHDVAGIEMHGVTFSDCTISLDGGDLHECVITGSTAAIAVSTNDPSNIASCEFVSAGTGHAIEITATGTFTFSGNTFSGYGSAGTSDAAIYNNSGGAVTLNITGGGDTPTVKNGSGASTTVVSGITLTFDGVAATSEIRIYRNSDGVEIAGVESCDADHAFSISSGLGDNCTVRIIHPSYRIMEFSYTIPAVNTTVPIQQEADRWYSNPA